MAAQQAQQAHYLAQQAAQNPRPPGEQPQPGQGAQPQAQPGSTPAFSLTDGGMEEDEGEEVEGL